MSERRAPCALAGPAGAQPRPICGPRRPVSFTCSSDLPAPTERELWPQDVALTSGLMAPPGWPRSTDTWGGLLASSNSGQLWAGPRGRCVPGKPVQWGPREGLHPRCLGPIGHGLHCRPLSTAPTSPSRGARSWAWRPGCRTQVWEMGSAPGAACGVGGPPTPQDPWRQHNRSPVLVVCGPVFPKLIAFSLRHLCFKIALDVLLRRKARVAALTGPRPAAS